jgi:hypothetical protein
MRIHFKDQTRYDFALQFLPGLKQANWTIQRYPQSLTLETDHIVLAGLLKRVSEERSIILPSFSSSSHAWIIAGATGQQLNLALTHIRRFLVPAYAQFEGDNRLPNKKQFDPEKNTLQQLGNILYPAGYYRLTSSISRRDTILHELDLWMQLEQDIPRPQPKQPPTYGLLYAGFNAALAATDWENAESAIREIHRLHLSAADNITFMRLQLLAQQKRWSDIWQADFANLARMNVTREVRATLLTAFHHSILLPLEQQGQWESAIEAFKQYRSQLGKLLTARLELTRAPVVQVYAYQAAVNQDYAALVALQEENTGSEAQACIKALLQLIDPSESRYITAPVYASQGPSPSPLYLAHQALNETDYDAATRYASQVEKLGEKALLLMQIATQTNDAYRAEEALLYYWDLSAEEQTALQARYSFVPKTLEILNKLINLSSANAVFSDPQPALAIQDWLEWFTHAKTDPHDTELTASLDRLAAVIDDRFWTPEKITSLGDKLFEFFDDPSAAGRPYAKGVLQRLIAAFLQDDNFPRPEEYYIILYETFYVTLQEIGELNQTTASTLLRLAEALLTYSPTRCTELCKHLQDWCSKHIIPNLEGWVLEAFELLSEYGLSPSSLSTWYRTWLSYLLNLPASRDRINLEIWLAFGNWIQPGTDLLNRLLQALATATEKESENPIQALPDDYQIGIFCLRESSAFHARDLLLARNNRLEIRICTDKVLSAQAQSIAENSDMVVIVTTCITHALTYGIGPYLTKNPVYPASSGSTSIVRAIEEQFLKTNKK